MKYKNIININKVEVNILLLKIILNLIFYLYYISFNKINEEKIYKKIQIIKKKTMVIEHISNYCKYNINTIYKMKKVIYSVIIGEYDQINSFQKKKDFDYFLFSDKNYNNTNWTILPIPKKLLKFNISNYKITRFIKIFPHLFFRNYELSIYIDAAYTIIGDLDELLLRILSPKYNMYSIQHPVRNKIFDEFLAVLDCKKEKKSIVNIVKNRYIKENFPDNLGLTENCIIYNYIKNFINIIIIIIYF